MGESVDRPEREFYVLQTLGCRTNQEEMDALRSHLRRLCVEHPGFPHPVPRLRATGESPAAPALAVVNTCAVTATALAKSRQMIRRAARLHGPRCWIVVTGCGAQLDPLALASLPGVGLVIGNAAKSALPRLFAALAGLALPPAEEDLLAAFAAAGLEPPERAASGAWISWSRDASLPRFLEHACPANGSKLSMPRGRTRLTLKIQDGCDRACAYCVVAGLRGRPRSKRVRLVLEEARRLIDAGAREIVLAGINLGLYEYGSDPGGGEDRAGAGLARLLERLLALPGLGRIRLSSLEPDTLGPQLLDLLAQEPRLCPHVHLALQSGDDEVLARMGRRYRGEDVRRIAARLHAGREGAGLGMDVIAGFPGESERAFAATLDLIAALPATYLHAFAYSERPGTSAGRLAGPVAPQARRERVRRARALDAELRATHQARLAGLRCAVVVERCDAAGAFEGTSGEYVRMRGVAPGVRRGELLDVVALRPSGSHWQPCRPALEARRASGKAARG